MRISHSPADRLGHGREEDGHLRIIRVGTEKGCIPPEIFKAETTCCAPWFFLGLQYGHSDQPENDQEAQNREDPLFRGGNR